MPVLPIVANLFVGVVAFATLPLSAQWQNVKTPRVPRRPNGTPELTAPAPKMADGKNPDLSGIWNPIRVPCTPSGIGADFGCSDVPLGVPIGLFDVTASGSEEGQPRSERTRWKPRRHRIGTAVGRSKDSHLSGIWNPVRMFCTPSGIVQSSLVLTFR